MPKIASTGKTPDKAKYPMRHYNNPKEIVCDDALTDRQKKEALNNWEIDALAMERAEDEGMGGGEPDMLIDVVDAKIALETKPRPKNIC